MKALILLVAVVALGLASCARPHNDGMGDLWRGVRQVVK